MSKTEPPSTPDTTLRQHNLSLESFTRTGLSWDSLCQIWRHHADCHRDLDMAGRAVANKLESLPQVHSLRVRVKAPDHLITKIIRKKMERPDETFDVHTYRQKVTDLVGVRALHLFKHDWVHIHDLVVNAWIEVEKPKAYHRQGDEQSVVESFEKKGCEPQVHSKGYRSVHYLISTAPTKEPITVEIQVRTLFEEAWSEMDHRLRYPTVSNDPVLAELLMVLNRLSGGADELGSTLHNFTVKATEATRERDDLKAELQVKERQLAQAIARVGATDEQKLVIQNAIAEYSKTKAALDDPRTIVAIRVLGPSWNRDSRAINQDDDECESCRHARAEHAHGRCEGAVPVGGHPHDPEYEDCECEAFVDSPDPPLEALPSDSDA